MNTQSAQKYSFGPLTLTVKGLGVYLGGDNLQSALDVLSSAELKQVNREAWRQRNNAVRIANRQSNVSAYGWNDRRDQLIDVANVVCRETWKRMKLDPKA